MKRRTFLGALGGGALAATPARAANRPNIVFILADDLGYGDLGCYGQRVIETPHLDRMASEGVRFTRAYAGHTVCAPSRCTIETGLHTGHANYRDNGPAPPLAPEDKTLGKLMKTAGYRTALAGKWSLGGLGTTGYPLEQGYDEWFGYFSQTHAHNFYPEHLLDGRSAVLLRGNFGARRTEYAPDLFTERALRFLDQDDPRPFFLHLCYNTPHANNEMGRDTGDGMQVPDYGAYAGRDWPNPEKGFAAMVSRLDRDVGRILARLRENGRDANTLWSSARITDPTKKAGTSTSFSTPTGLCAGISAPSTTAESASRPSPAGRAESGPAALASMCGLSGTCCPPSPKWPARRRPRASTESLCCPNCSASPSGGTTTSTGRRTGRTSARRFSWTAGRPSAPGKGRPSSFTTSSPASTSSPTWPPGVRTLSGRRNGYCARPGRIRRIGRSHDTRAPPCCVARAFGG